MFYIVSLFWILSISGLLTLIFKKKSVHFFSISILLGSLLLYLFGFINNIKLGFYFSWIFVAIFWIRIIYLIINKDKSNIKEFVKNYFNVGLIVFIILSIYVFILCKYQGFSNCDEFSHWGPMLKETLRLNGFYCQNESRLIMHKDYPPLFTLLQTLWCGFSNFEYHESIAYIAMLTFMFSLFIPLFSNLKIKSIKDIIKSIIITIMIVLIGITIDVTNTMSDSAFVYNSIYVDWVLAVFASYVIFNINKIDIEDKYAYLFYSITFSSFLLMKQIGIFFYLLSLLYLTIKLIFIDKNKNIKKYIKICICVLLIPMLVFVTWKLLVGSYEIIGQFGIRNIKINEFIDILNYKSDISWKNETFVNFVDAIKNRVLATHPFEMTFFCAIAFLSALMSLVCCFIKKGIVPVLVFLFGSIAYVFTLLVLYTMVFTVDEAPILASFNRYVLSYIYFGMTLILFYFVDGFFNSLIVQIIGLVLLLTFIEPKTFNHIVPKLSISEAYSKKVPVFVVEQFHDGTDFSREEVNGLVLDLYEPGYLGDWQEDYNRFVKGVEGSDGIYIIGYDDTIIKFWKQYGLDCELTNSAYYSIDKDNKFVVFNDSFSFIHYVIKYYSL